MRKYFNGFGITGACLALTDLLYFCMDIKTPPAGIKIIVLIVFGVLLAKTMFSPK